MNLFDTEEITKPRIDLAEIAELLNKASGICCDLETTGLSFEDDYITVVSFSCMVDGVIKGWAIEVRDHPIAEIYKAFFHVLHDPTKIIVFHNAGFDTKFLNKEGIFYTNRVADTMIMLWLRDEDRIRGTTMPDGTVIRGYGLKENVLKFFNYKMSSYEDARSLFGNFIGYAADDAVQTLKLYFLLEKDIEKFGLTSWMWDVEMPIVRILIEVETRGVCLDKVELKKLKAEAFKQIEEIEKKIHELVGYKFQVSSAKQLARILFQEMKLGFREDGTNQFSHRGKITPSCPDGEWSTNDEVLEAMKRELTDGNKPKIPLAGLILEYRDVNTRLNTFIKPLLDRCIKVPYTIFPRFIQTGTATGRFSSKDPNYQNLPKKGGIRKCFIARKGYKIVRADYSQAELRLMAHMSGDPIMIDIYRNNGDIHQTTADACGVTRDAAKAINFGLVYRMSAARLQGQLALGGIIISIPEAQRYVNRYFKKYRNVRDYHQKVEKAAMKRLEETGEYAYVKTLGGRLRRIYKDYLTAEETAFSAITQLINATIQGGVSDLIKMAMVECQEIFRTNGWLDPEKGIWRAYIQGQVHDELFVECEEELAEKVAKIVTHCMENAGRKFKIRVPMTAEAKIVDHLGKG